MIFNCPKCNYEVDQERNPEGLNFCPRCRKLFILPPVPKMPPWILGVLVVLTVHWQIICRH
jgi:hypothetical protein